MAKKEKESTALVKTENPAALGLVAMFKPVPGAAALELPKAVQRRNLPQLIKPGDVPIGVMVSGEILQIIDSLKSTIKGKLIWLRHESGKEFLFPLTGVIRAALFPGTSNTDGSLEKAVEKGTEIGKTLYALRLEDRPSKYVADSSGKKKTMFSFDVYTSDKA